MKDPLPLACSAVVVASFGSSLFGLEIVSVTSFLSLTLADDVDVDLT